MSASVFFLAIGDELLDGRVRDKNIHYAGQILSDLGLALNGAQIFPDDVNLLKDVIATAAAEHDLVWISGGLGPTVDDKTVDAVAAAFELPVVEVPEIKQHIERAAARLGRKALDLGNRQARIPKGAAYWLNGAGTAPGICLSVGHAHVVCMPGVPRELQWLTEQHLVPFLQKKLSSKPLPCESLRCFGLPEAQIAEKLQPLSEGFAALKMQYRPTFPETILRLTASDGDPSMLARAVKQARGLLGGICYGTGTATLEQRIVRQLTDRKELLVVAESCTGGLLAQRLSSVPGASKCFYGGVITYANEAKTEILGVRETTLQETGAVSEAVAREMIRGALRIAPKAWALSVTGVAGPNGGTEEKPVGTVCFGLGHGSEIFSKRRQLGHWSRDQIQLLSVHVALHWLRKQLDA